MKLKKALLPAIAAAMAAQMANGQEITPKWFQHINGSFGVSDANKLPILKKQGQDADTAYNGRELMDGYANLIRYDATRLLLGVRENGIDEQDPATSPADLALAAQYPDRSLIFLDAETGKPLGLAWKESFRPDLLAGVDVTTMNQGSAYAWWRVALDEGPEGSRALYSAFKNVFLRYAPKAGGGWETTPTVAYIESTPGAPGDKLTNGDGNSSMRWRDFHVKGSGVNTVIYAGGGTWRAGAHPQVLKTTDGLHYVPKGRVDNRDNGARRNDYALGGLSSFPVDIANTYGSGTPISVVYAGHYPGTGYGARPNRYTSDSNNPLPSPAYNQQPDVAIYARNETGYAGLPQFNWEAAGKDGLPINHAVDGVDHYDGNWNGALASDPNLSYVVGYSMPSWDNQFGEIKKPAWIGIHRLDGSIASGKSSLKLDFTEVDEPITAYGATGGDYLYDPWVELNPDKSAPANSGKAELLVSFGATGFGVYTVQNVAASLVSSPTSKTVAAGSDVTLTANVAGSPNDFQWYRNGAPLAPKSYYLGGVKKASLQIIHATQADVGSYQLKWTNPISGAGQTASANLDVTGNETRLTHVDIVPEGLSVPVHAGNTIPTGANSLTVSSGGLKARPGATDPDQPGDIQQFAYEAIAGDFDKAVKLTSLTTDATVPNNAAAAGIEVRASLDPLSSSLMLNASNPEGDNAVHVLGRGIDRQNYSVFSRGLGGVKANLPNQWLRVRRAGNNFSFYVGTDGVTWSLVGQRYSTTLPGQVLVGVYALSSAYNATDAVGNDAVATATFANYGDTVITDTVAPALVSVGTGDKKVIGVKFSEVVNTASATLRQNYKLSQGTINNIRPGISGDSVYLDVTGLVSDTFTVTVLGGVQDQAGNVIAANSVANGKVSNWLSTDIGHLQPDPNTGVYPPPRKQAGDDPYVVGQAVAVSSGATETEIEIVGGGSNAWSPGDYIHYLNNGTQLDGDFDVMAEVSRNDRPANTAGWGNSGLMMRESAYVKDLEYTQEGTKAAMVALTTYMEGDAPGRSAIPLWRDTTGGGYGNGGPVGWGTVIGGVKGYYPGLAATDASGKQDPDSSPLSGRWLRIARSGNVFTFSNSHDGKTWNPMGNATLALPSKLLFGFSSMNDTGGNAPPNNAYGGNGHDLPDDTLFGNQNESNYAVQRVRIGTNVAPPSNVKPSVSIVRNGDGSLTITFVGSLQASDTLTGFAPVAGASPLTIPASAAAKFYRAAQ